MPDIILDKTYYDRNIIRLPLADGTGKAKYIDATNKTGAIISQYHEEEDYSVGITPIQTGTGDPSPTNIRPISGWTGANIWVDGKHGGNIYWNQEIPAEYKTYTKTYSSDSSSYYVTTFSSKHFPLSAGHVYYVAVTVERSISGNNGIDFSMRYAPSQTFVRFEYPNGEENGKKSALVTATEAMTEVEGSAFNNYYYKKGYNTGDSFTYNNLMVCDLTAMFGAGNEPTLAEFEEMFPSDYYAYNAGETTCVSAVNGDPYYHHTMSWQSEAGTVYGGTLDVTLGKLRVTHKSVNMGNIAWSKDQITTGGHYFFRKSISDRKTGTGLSPICSAYKYWGEGTTSVINNNCPDVQFAFQSTNTFVCIRDDRYTDATDFINSVTGQTLVYELATPLEYDLTPTEIQLLLGQNNIWADCGDITVTWATP